MTETIFSIMQWHAEIFPDATLDGQLEKYQEEQTEFVESNYKDVTELADMFIVACGIARFDIHEGLFYFADIYDWFNSDITLSIEDLQRAVDEKMAVNRQRTWHKQNGLYKHNTDDAK